MAEVQTPSAKSDNYEKVVSTPNQTSNKDWDEKPKQRRCTPLVVGKACIIGGTVLVVISILYATVLPVIINNKIESGVVVCDANGYKKEKYLDPYGNCEECTPYYFSLTMFNATNAEAYVTENAKLQLQEVGPYVYRRREIKTEVVFDESTSETVSYKKYTYHTFDPELSCEGCLESDLVTNYDTGYMNVISQAGGETAFLTKLIQGSFGKTLDALEIADIIAANGTQMMRWVNGLNSMQPELMRVVGSDSTVLKFLTAGASAINDLELSSFAYNGIFASRTISQWALGYPSLLAGLALGSNYVNVCEKEGMKDKCASCEGEECFEIFGDCNKCTSGAKVMRFNNVTCEVIEATYAAVYGEEEAATFAQTTCGLCETFGLCAAPLPGTVEPSGLDWSRGPPPSEFMGTYIQRTGCDDLNSILVYEQFSGYTSTPFWTSLGERRNPTLAEINAFLQYGNCANPAITNITCNKVQGNDGTSVRPHGVSINGFAESIPIEKTDMYLSQAKQNISLWNLHEEVEYEGVPMHRFGPPNDLLVHMDWKDSKGTGYPVDGVQPLAFTTGFLTYVSYPLYLYGDSKLTENVEITMTNGVSASKSSMYESDGTLKQEYADKYVTFIDIEAGTGKTMRARKRLMASYAIANSTLVDSLPMTDILWPDLQPEIIVPIYWGEESATVQQNRIDQYMEIKRLLMSLIPVLVIGLVAGVGLFSGGIVYRRRLKMHQHKEATV